MRWHVSATPTVVEKRRERDHRPIDDVKGGLMSFAIEAAVVVCGVVLAVLVAVVVLALL